MSTITPIARPLPGERVAALSPGDAVAAATDWLRRPNLFAGRTLTAPTLEGRQRWQAGRIAQRGQAFSAGVVQGLELSHVVDPPVGDTPQQVRLFIEPGQGLAASGEDVLLLRRVECRLADVPVVAPPAWFAATEPAPEADDDPAAAATVAPRAIGPALASVLVSAGTRMSRIGVLLLQPVTMDVSPIDPDDPCDRCGCGNDTAAFEDWRIGDGARLLWYPWPEEWLALPATANPARLRNALAHAIFNAEATLPEGAVLPWAEWGVPVAIVALDAAADAATAAAAEPAFSDRAAVVRQGGRARDARLAGVATVTETVTDAVSALVADSQLPMLWQARIEQFAEQIAEFADANGDPPPAQLADPFLWLPPVGLLPKAALDFGSYRSDFFPPGVVLDAVPMPIEQLDVAIRDAAALAPIDLSAPERVRLLVPVTQASYEPRLLQTEVIAPEFQQTLDRFLLTRARELGARQGLRNEVALLGRILSGQPQTVPAFNDDPLAVEPESLSPWGPPPAGGGHRSALRAGIHQHYFDGATETLTPAAGDSLFAWVYLDPDHPPRTLLLQWHTGGSWEHRAFWGDDLIPWGAANSAAHLRIGDLPETGRWLMLAVPARALGLAAQPIDGMGFALYDGQAAYAMTGSRSGNAETKWFCNVLPAGARTLGDEPFEMLTNNDLWAPFEPARGVIPAIPASVPGVGASQLVPGGHVEPLRSGIHQHFFEGAAPFTTANDPFLYAWVYIDPNDPPREVMLQWLAGNFEHRAFWGWDLIPWGVAGNARRRAGGLPVPGEWVRLAVAVGDVGIAATQPITGMGFVLFDGTAAFGPAGAMTVATTTDATGATVTTVTERPWFAGALPPRAQPRGSWQFLSQRELYAPTGTSRIGKVQAVRDLLADPLLAVLSDQERAQLTVKGLAPFVTYLRQRIDRADDLTDYGFVKMQTDIYRMRQLMLGSTDASRVTVSPALAGIAKAETAVATQAQISDYVAQLKKPATTNTTPRAAGLTTAATAATAVNAATATFSTGSATLSNAALNLGTSAAKLNLDLDLISLKNLALLQQTPPRTVPVATAAVVTQATYQPIYRPNQFSPIDVVLSNPVVGKSAIRTTAIADRLKQPASQEARDYALATRHDSTARLLGLVADFTAEDGGMLPGLFDGFAVYGLAGDPFLADLNAPGRPAVRSRKLADFTTNPALLNALLDSPGRNAVDEGTLFSETADMSDNTVALLRQVEGRLARYRDALTRCEFALTDLQNAQVDAVQRQDAAGDRLAEARHDVGVARALIAEEAARLAAVNARRAQVLAKEVRFIAFMRPRETSSVLAAPRRAIDPALAEAPVPACLRQHDDVPDELDDMLRVVREAPAAWFVRTPPLFDRLDRSDLLLRTLRSAQLRGTLLAQRAVAAPAVAATGKLADAVTQVITRQAPTLSTRIATVSAIDLTQAAALTWQGLRAQLPAVLSFGDLIDGDHGKGAVAQAAAAEFQRIAAVCACLHAEFCGVSASIRLDWAELMSEFDDPPNLRNGANLPRWSEIDSTDRRQMQAYIDWLFAQVDPAVTAAVALVNDLVRMALLLASHAPIGRIVAGRLPRPVTGVRPGVRIPLITLNAGAALRVGMQAIVYRDSTVLARAVVEDIGAGEVSARVLFTAAAQVDLATDMRVHFDNAAVVSAGAAQQAALGVNVKTATTRAR